jgi:hypothetical protein
MTKLVLVIVAVALLGSLGTMAHSSQAAGHQPTITVGARARMQSTKLGVGWRTGHIAAVTVPGPIAGSVRCLAFVPDPPMTVARIMISVSDTLELWVVDTSDSASTRGSWVGVPREDRLEASCQLG